jgi:hypothetical protein
MGHLIPKPRLESFSEGDCQKYQAAINQTICWHGNGKLPVFAFEQYKQLYANKRFSELVSQTK